MMKKRKKALIVLLVFLILVVISITILKILSLQKAISNPSEETNNNVPIIAKFRQVSPCIDNFNCPNIITATYAEIEYDYDDEQMQKWIQKTNQETEQYYQETINSDVSDANCSQEIKKYLQYSIITENEYYIYASNRYTSLAVKRIKRNLCTDEKKHMQTDVYLYDKEQRKQITQDDLKNILLVTDDFVQQAISKNIELINQNDNKNLTLEDTYKDGKLDYILYYNSSGKLMASYYQNSEQAYYSTVVLYK